MSKQVAPAFRRVHKAEQEGHYMDEIALVPALLVLAFGVPTPTGTYKSSGEYIFRSPDGTEFVVAEWKSTNLYDPELIKPEEFWSSRHEQSLVIRGQDIYKLPTFREFLRASIRAAIAPKERRIR